ncbi:hypothetical protein BDN71DRAFT_190229 [Pleurotus eryngii]|uniref:Uncharacterized protein n=1 Tax=Pleurotus eryngii TaxID=5323 RepID=A0A9P6DC67_PLEER|nr:hypothetical protein BDN71DRAFT_190229 [Pleurotus eryngii]
MGSCRTGSLRETIVVVGIYAGLVHARCETDPRGIEHCSFRTWTIAVIIAAVLILMISACTYLKRRRRLRATTTTFIGHNMVKPHVQPPLRPQSSYTPSPANQASYSSNTTYFAYQPSVPPYGQQQQTAYQQQGYHPSYNTTAQPTYPPPAEPPRQYAHPASPPPLPRRNSASQQDSPSHDSNNTRWSSFNPYNNLVAADELVAPMPMPMPSIPSPHQPPINPPAAHTRANPSAPSSPLTSDPVFTPASNLRPSASVSSADTAATRVSPVQTASMPQLTDAYSLHPTKQAVVLSPSFQEGASSSGAASRPSPQSSLPPVHHPANVLPPASPPPRVTSPANETFDPPPRYSEFN